jgi:hypothetical protein
MKVFAMTGSEGQLRDFGTLAVVNIASGGGVVMDITQLMSVMLGHVNAAQQARNNQQFEEAQRIVDEHLTPPFGLDITQLLTETIAATCERLELFVKDDGKTETEH